MPMSLKLRIAVIMVVLIVLVSVDQVTKSLARSMLSESAVLSYVGDTMRLQLGFNAGATLNLGAWLPDTARTLIFTFGAAIALGGFFIYLVITRSLRRDVFLALCLVLAGGLGNLFDRIFNGGVVTDFMNIGIGPIRSGIFNVADMAITGGGLFLLGHALWQRHATAPQNS